MTQARSRWSHSVFNQVMVGSLTVAIVFGPANALLAAGDWWIHQPDGRVTVFSNYQTSNAIHTHVRNYPDELSAQCGEHPVETLAAVVIAAVVSYALDRYFNSSPSAGSCTNGR